MLQLPSAFTAKWCEYSTAIYQHSNNAILAVVQAAQRSKLLRWSNYNRHTLKGKPEMQDWKTLIADYASPAQAELLMLWAIWTLLFHDAFARRQVSWTTAGRRKT